ncbi:hypothetical protein U14_00513 [Candidatus Moduliflexus flocculans]|uniref:Uncharacterized protein n=1 Tax=Candidatus Moduliflexus flocculans TaxID=1499966 RepID=A0A0S6VUH0_9BACT|nr:hypothetical protein U14_00513 [Candidatus Moduliflexus flocculans]
MIEMIWGRSVLGGGTLKLLMVVGVTVGVLLAFEVGITFIILTTIIGDMAKFWWEVEEVPTSPMICCSTLLIYTVNYWKLLHCSVNF